ncbi:unnamed protein product [Larinioides sclopetarius]|uniref:Uncharacterized protein n=1 Tax=Larinioides sclopetarius TaxID=280406 RepID=A0AAV1YR80_9ARAC
MREFPFRRHKIAADADDLEFADPPAPLFPQTEKKRVSWI